MSDNERARIPNPERPSSPALLPGSPLIPSPSPVEPGEGVGGEGESWHQVLPAIRDSLREIGYDVASPRSGAPPGDSIVARRDLGDRAVVLAIDAGGRFRAEIAWVVGEWPSRDEIAGAPVQVVDAVSRTVTVTGQMAEPKQVVAVVTGLGTIAPWAGVAAPDEPPPPG